MTDLNACWNKTSRGSRPENWKVCFYWAVFNDSGSHICNPVSLLQEVFLFIHLIEAGE